MKNKLNRFFSAIIMPTAMAYIFIGLVVSILVLFFFSPKQSVVTANFGKLAGAYVTMLFANLVIVAQFYNLAERRRENGFSARSGMVLHDKYFKTKINSGLSKGKLLLGYVYAAMRSLQLVSLGMILGVLFFMNITG